MAVQKSKRYKQRVRLRRSIQNIDKWRKLSIILQKTRKINERNYGFSTRDCTFCNWRWKLKRKENCLACNELKLFLFRRRNFIFTSHAKKKMNIYRQSNAYTAHIRKIQEIEPLAIDPSRKQQAEFDATYRPFNRADHYPQIYKNFIREEMYHIREMYKEQLRRKAALLGPEVVESIERLIEKHDKLENAANKETLELEKKEQQKK